MRAPTAEQESLLRGAAHYRALGGRWDVVAFHLELPTDEIRGLVRRFRPVYKQHARWERLELFRRKRTEQRLELRRAFRNAGTPRKKAKAVSRIGRLEAEREREWVERLKVLATRRIRASRAEREAARIAAKENHRRKPRVCRLSKIVRSRRVGRLHAPAPIAARRETNRKLKARRAPNRQSVPIDPIVRVALALRIIRLVFELPPSVVPCGPPPIATRRRHPIGGRAGVSNSGQRRDCLVREAITHRERIRHERAETHPHCGAASDSLGNRDKSRCRWRPRFRPNRCT